MASRAALAFAMLAMITALVLSICVIFDMHKFKQFVLVALAIAALFMFIAWPIGFALRTSIECAGGKLSDLSGNKTGASAPLLMISFFILIADLVVWFLIKEADEGSANEPTGTYTTTTTTSTTTTTHSAQKSSSLY